MSTVKEYRRRGFQARRLSFALKVITGLWAISMIGLFITQPTFLGLMVAITGGIVFCAPALLITVVLDDRAERNFNLAAAHKQVALLGVVPPKN